MYNCVTRVNKKVCAVSLTRNFTRFCYVLLVNNREQDVYLVLIHNKIVPWLVVLDVDIVHSLADPWFTLLVYGFLS